MLGPIFDTSKELFQADDFRPGFNDLLELVAALLEGKRDAALVLFLLVPFLLCEPLQRLDFGLPFGFTFSTMGAISPLMDFTIREYPAQSSRLGLLIRGRRSACSWKPGTLIHGCTCP